MTDSGTAIPLINVLNILGGTGIATSGSGDTILITSTGVVTLDGNTGSATASGNVINVVGTGSLTSAGASSTLTFSLTGLTSHAVLVGAGTATITKVGPTATAGQVLQSAGSSSDPVFSTATYPATTTINQVLYSSSSNVVGGITASDNGVLISGTTGIPSWLAAGTTGQVLVATTSNPASWGTLSSIAVTSITATAPLTANTASGTPESGAVTIALTTPMSLTYGGTNASLTASAGGIFYSTASAGAILGGTATANQALLSGSSASPAWSTATYPATTTINQVLYSSSNNVIAGITAGANGVLVSSNTNVPSWLANSGTAGFVLTANSGAPPSWQATGASSVTITGDTGGGLLGNSFTFTASGIGLSFGGSGSTQTLSGTLKVANGGTGANTLTGVLIGNGTSAVTGNAVTQYDVLVGGASNAISSIGPGTALQILQSGGNAANPAYSTATYPATTTVNQLLYSSSSNVVAGLATANQGVLTTGTGGIPAITAMAGNGELIIGSTAGAPAAATLTAGAGVSITNGSNSITIASSGGGFTWHDVTGGSATLAAQNGYIADSGSLTTFTLPTNNAFGDTIRVVGKGSGGWTIVYGASQNIVFGTSTSTTTSGSLSSNAAADCVELICTTASASAPIFTVFHSQGNITVV